MERKLYLRVQERNRIPAQGRNGGETHEVAKRTV
jgi:hypothetical protein